MQSCRLIASLHTKQVQACWKNDAIEPNYCIIIFKHFQTYLIIMQSKKRYSSTISNSFEHVQKNMQLLHHYFQIVLNMLQIWCGQAWAGLVWAIERMMQSNKIIASLFPTVLNIFKIWCNQNKLLHHLLLSKEAFPFQKMLQSKQIIASLFPTVLNMFKIWCNQNKLLHHLYQCFQNKFFLFKRWCN